MHNYTELDETKPSDRLLNIRNYQVTTFLFRLLQQLQDQKSRHLRILNVW